MLRLSRWLEASFWRAGRNLEADPAHPHTPRVIGRSDLPRVPGDPLNYRRAAMSERLMLDRSQASQQAILELGRTSVAQLNRLHQPAHAGGWRTSPWRERRLQNAYESILARLGRSPAAPGRLKSSPGPYFRWASVDGMMNPLDSRRSRTQICCRSRNRSSPLTSGHIGRLRRRIRGELQHLLPAFALGCRRRTVAGYTSTGRSTPRLVPPIDNTSRRRYRTVLVKTSQQSRGTCAPRTDTAAAGCGMARLTGIRKANRVEEGCAATVWS